MRKKIVLTLLWVGCALSLCAQSPGPEYSLATRYCALDAALLLAKLHKLPFDRNAFADRVNADKDWFIGVSIGDFVAALVAQGMPVIARKITEDELRSGKEAVILFVHGSHYVTAVPTPVDVVVADQTYGVRRMTYGELKEIWKGEAILLDKNTGMRGLGYVLLGVSVFPLLIFRIAAARRKRAAKVALLLLLPLGICGQSHAAPELFIPRPDFDFGELVPGKDVAGEIELVNRGSSRLNIKHVKASCSCIELSRRSLELEPGATASVGFTIPAKDTVGTKKWSISFVSDDAAKPLQSVAIRYELLGGKIYSIPPRLRVTNAERGKPLDTFFRVMDADAKADLVKVQLPSGITAGKSVFDGNFTFFPITIDTAVAASSGTITLLTNATDVPTIEVPYQVLFFDGATSAGSVTPAIKSGARQQTGGEDNFAQVLRRASDLESSVQGNALLAHRLYAFAPETSATTVNFWNSLKVVKSRHAYWNGETHPGQFGFLLGDLLEEHYPAFASTSEFQDYLVFLEDHMSSASRVTEFDELGITTDFELGKSAAVLARFIGLVSPGRHDAVVSAVQAACAAIVKRNTINVACMGTHEFQGLSYVYLKRSELLGRELADQVKAFLTEQVEKAAASQCKDGSFPLNWWNPQPSAGFVDDQKVVIRTGHVLDLIVPLLELHEYPSERLQAAFRILGTRAVLCMDRQKKVSPQFYLALMHGVRAYRLYHQDL